MRQGREERRLVSANGSARLADGDAHSQNRKSDHGAGATSLGRNGPTRHCRNLFWCARVYRFQLSVCVLSVVASTMDLKGVASAGKKTLFDMKFTNLRAYFFGF